VFARLERFFPHPYFGSCLVFLLGVLVGCGGGPPNGRFKDGAETKPLLLFFFSSSPLPPPSVSLRLILGPYAGPDRSVARFRGPLGAIVDDVSDKVMRVINVMSPRQRPAPNVTHSRYTRVYSYDTVEDADPFLQ